MIVKTAIGSWSNQEFMGAGERGGIWPMRLASTLEETAQSWRDSLNQELASAVPLRWQLHREPPLSGAEGRTAEYVATYMCASERIREDAIAETGRLVRVGPAKGPSVGVRAELDALPIEEQTGSAYSATNGAMHACGHDVHLAALAALVRSAQLVELPAALLAILQPREELPPSGANDIVNSGQLQQHDVRAVIGAHLQPRVEADSVASDEGPVNAARAEVRITVDGRGGHAAYPHLAMDPVPALCEAVLGLYGIAHRAIDPMHPVVLTITQLDASRALNVIPGGVEALGSVRTLHPADARTIDAKIREIVAGIAMAHGCTADVSVTDLEPALVNDQDLTTVTRRRLSSFGIPLATRFESCGSDDFAWYGTTIPSLMMFVGTGPNEGATNLHDSRFLPSDQRISDVAHAMLAGCIAGFELLGQS
jgi:amidohydrolase